MSTNKRTFGAVASFLRHFSLITAFGIPHGAYPEQKYRDSSLPLRMTGHCSGGILTATTALVSHIGE
jgi:hypothetical protein